ncbi:MAG: hypothetical protein ACM3S1_11015 [Hyphomicrobiales bacterium]
MTRSWLFRVGVVLVVIGVLGGIAAGIARGFDDDDRTIEYRVVNSEGQELPAGQQPVIVVDDHGRDFPRGAFFPVFPIVLIGGVLIVGSIIASRGGVGPGRWRNGLDEWHRDAHRRDASSGETGS